MLVERYPLRVLSSWFSQLPCDIENVNGEVRMCPVNLERLEALVHDLTEQDRRERGEYAFRLEQLRG